MEAQVVEKKLQPLRRCLTCIHWKPTTETLGVCLKSEKKVTKRADQVCKHYKAVR